MKILIVRPRLEWGGATISIFLLADVLREMGHEVLLASAEGEMLETASRKGLQVSRVPLVPSSAFSLVRSFFALLEIVRCERVDVIHSHHRFSNLVCRLVAAWTGIPLVVTVHEYKHNLFFLTRLGLPGPVVTYSENLRRHLGSQYGVPPEKIAVVEMGIREPVHPVPEVEKTTGIVRIGCFARLVEEKGVDVLLKAAAEPRLGDRKNVEYLVVGDGPLRQRLEAQAVNGLPIRFLGWVDTIEKVLAQVDFIVLPSRTEGFGMVILEALRYRIPAIASRVGSIPELIEDGQTGLLVAPDDPRELAGAIVSLLDDANRVREMGAAGFSRIEKRYSVRAMGEQMLQVYQDALEAKLAE